MDWSDCVDVERDGDKISGAWVIKGSRVPVQAVIDNARDGFSPEVIAEMFEGLSVDQVRGVLRFAGLYASHPA
jgi:uncharacterized protein (DUF433 family)